MRITLKRYPRQEIRNGNVELPRSLSFLGREDFEAVVRRNAGRRPSWGVELKPATLKKLFADQKHLSDCEGREEALRAELAQARKALAIKDAELQEALEGIAVRQHNLDILRSRLDGHDDSRTPPPSHGKNFFQHAEDTGMNLRKRALPGGLPGLGKR